MANLTIISNIGPVSKLLAERLQVLSNPEYLLRPIAFDVIDLMTKRIHIDGKDSSNGQIGTYSSGYMRERARNNRKEGTKVIVSLTRQLENDWSVIATPKGYGVGFKNIFNAKKMRWVEGTYDKEIASLAPEELQHVSEMVTELVQKALSGK